MKLSTFLLRFFFIAACWERLSAVIFNCNLFESTHGPLGYVYACYLNRLEEVENPKVTAVLGKHKLRKTNADVKLLHITKVRIDFIPQNIEKNFPNLVGMFIHNTGVKKISQDDFKPFPSLSYVTIQNSEIEELPNGLFDHNEKINYLNFQKNKLKLVGSKVLASVPNLKYANFDGNSCVNAKAENPSQIDFLKSQIVNCYSKSDQDKDDIVCPPTVLSCPPQNCALSKDKEVERLKKELSVLKIEIANLRTKNRKIQQKHNETTEICQRNIPDRPNPRDVSSFKSEISDLKMKLAHQEVTVKSFKDDLAKKVSEFKFETDKSIDCKNKLIGVTTALSQVNERLKHHQGNPEIAVKSYGKINRFECIEALKSCISDKTSCGNENEYLRSKLGEMNSLELICEVSKWDRESSCNAVNLKCLEENQKISMVKSKAHKSLDKTKINELLVLNQHALFLPLGIGEVFTNLISMTLTNSHLTKLDSSALTFQNLKSLSLAANKISEIFFSDLSSLEKLEILDLSDNQIKKVAPGALDNLFRIKVLKLNGNQMEEIDNDLFEKNTKLTGVFLQQNRLKFVGPEILMPLRSLSIIDFSDNICVKAVYTDASIKSLKQIFTNQCGKPTRLCCRFEKLSGKDLSCRAVDFKVNTKSTKLNSVKSFDDCISEDSLIDPRVISRTDIDEHDYVTVLEIIDGSVHYLPTNLADFFEKLKKLVVVNSQLKFLSKHSFEGLRFLNFIQISHNDITSFEPEVFAEIVSLKHLDISSNKLSEFPQKFFGKMSGLVFLNASNNELGKIDADLFPRQNSLIEIYFGGCSIYDVDVKLFNILKVIKIIDFSNNACIDSKYPDDGDKGQMQLKAAQC